MTKLRKDTHPPLPDVVEFFASPEPQREHIDTIIEETDRLIRKSFSPADARRNPKVERNLRMLSALQGVSYENTCTTFGLPLYPAEKARITSPHKEVSPQGKTVRQVESTRWKKRKNIEPVIIDPNRVLEFIRQGKRPIDIAHELGLEDQYARKKLRNFLVNSGFTTIERQRIQREANQDIEMLIEQIKETVQKNNYFDSHVSVLIEELRAMYDISLRQIAEEILFCDVQLLYAHRQIHK